MQIELPIDIEEARELLEHPHDVLKGRGLLEEAIEQTDHGKRTKYFEEALDILDDYISDYPETPHKTFIETIRLTYTKKLLEGLSSIREPDIDIFFRYFEIFWVKVGNEFKIICEKFPNLKEEYDSYIDFFKGFIE